MRLSIRQVKVIGLVAIMFSIQFVFNAMYFTHMYKPTTPVEVQVPQPYPVEFQVEVPVEVIKEVPVEVEKIVEKEVIKTEKLYIDRTEQGLGDCIRVDSNKGTMLDCGANGVYRWSE